MHMADALLTPEVGGTMWLVSGAAVAVASRAVRRSADSRQVPLMGVLGAFVFAAQMINVSIPGTGSSGHFAGGLLLAILLGPHPAFLTIASVLVVQALFFADGGLLALGANIFNMGFVACYLVYPLIYRPLAGVEASGFRRRAVTWLAAILALQLGALGVVLETTASGIAELPFTAFLAAMQPIHLAIGIVEGLITVAVVEFVARAEPGLVDPAARQTGRRVLAPLAIAAALISGALSWFASADPDGLEWSIARLTGEAEIAVPENAAHRAAAELQGRAALLPDYAFPGADEAAEPGWSTPNAGTTVSGLVGGTLTLLLAVAIGWALRLRRNRLSAWPR